MEEKIIVNILNNLMQDKDLGGDSTKWANWQSMLTLTTCLMCVKNHGKIVDISVMENKKRVNAHPNCKCVFVPMRTKKVGTSSDMGIDGVDVYLFFYNQLTEYYVSKETAYGAGWKSKSKKLDRVLPGKMIGGDRYFNDDQKLPTEVNRVWYEADIDYTGGRRNGKRILYSNDGLIFVSDDHYQTFYEIVGTRSVGIQ